MKRRDFLKGTFGAVGSLFCGELFAAPPGWQHDGEPNLVFGVISDTHLRTTVWGNRLGANWPDKYLVAALKYFKEQNVDAVMHCGDMAHRGQVQEMAFHAGAWRRVFGKVTSGPVKLFVTGNHDVDGARYGNFVKKRYPDPEQYASHVLETDMAANWQRIWGEKYEPVWHKEVKGYHFFGRNWGVSEAEAIAALKNWKSGRDPLHPYFYIQHSRPSYGVRRELMRHVGAVSFFGHNHWSITNWNIIALYKNRLPVIQCASCEPRGCGALVGDGWFTKAAIDGRDQTGRGRQGYVVRVYNDMLVIQRREFTAGAGAVLGSDWILPLGKFNPHPFIRSEMKKVIGEPQFQSGAKLLIESADVPAEEGKPAKSVVKLSIPLADANPDSRVYAYEVAISSGDASHAGGEDEVMSPNKPDSKTPTSNWEPTLSASNPIYKAVYASGVNLGIGSEPNGGVTQLTIPKAELPHNKALSFTVRPLTSLGTSGKPITAEFKE
ncbi:MAG: metallophosphoesterase [Thermoguttaceae bacterium]|nr:metallophosphoesterase [Thermoguttaceae bacterium]